MAATFPPDPLLDALKHPVERPPERGYTLAERPILGEPRRFSIPMDAAAPWPGGPLDANTGIRWYTAAFVWRIFGVIRFVPIQIVMPFCRLHVDEHGVEVRFRSSWLYVLAMVSAFFVTGDTVAEFAVPWESVTAVRRQRLTWRSQSAIEFCVGGIWMGVATNWTRSLDRPWSAIVHFYRASRATASTVAAATATQEGVR